MSGFRKKVARMAWRKAVGDGRDFFTTEVQRVASPDCAYFPQHFFKIYPISLAQDILFYLT